MGKKLSPEQMELYRRVDEVIYYIWDPIGVREYPMARDEYYSYLLQIFSLLVNRDSKEVLVSSLIHIQHNIIGLTPNIDHAQKVADILLEYRDLLLNSPSI